MELCQAALDGRLESARAVWDARPCLGVVLAAEGYPADYEKGHPISGLEGAFPDHDKVFHAGTGLNDGQVVTAGGRVLCVCALGETVGSAQQQAYAACDEISWSGAFCRRDIGYRAIRRERG